MKNGLLLILICFPLRVLAGEAETRVNQYIIEIYKKQEIERERARVDGLRLPQVAEEPIPLSDLGTKSKSHGVMDGDDKGSIYHDPVFRGGSERPADPNLGEMVEKRVEQQRDLSSIGSQSEKELIESVKRKAAAAGYVLEFDPKNPTRVIRVMKAKK